MNLNTESDFDSRKLRKTVLQMAMAGSTVHIGCAFSIIELLAVLYRNHIRYPGNDPQAIDRDYLVLSKGHGVMAQYACMYEKGWLSANDRDSYFSDGSELKGLSDSRVAGLEVTSGSLGHGFSVGVGLAFAAKLKSNDQRTFVLVGDGELNEGAIWEGALVAAHHRLKNFVVLVDKNGFQAMGSTDTVLNLGAIEDKFASFGFECLVVDGHDECAIDLAVKQLLMSESDAPKAIIANTTKGKGVPFMENNNMWHYTRLNPETYQAALDAVAGEGV